MSSALTCLTDGQSWPTVTEGVGSWLVFQPFSSVSVSHAAKVLKPESLGTFPWRSQWTYLCQADPVHLRKPLI